MFALPVHLVTTFTYASEGAMPPGLGAIQSRGKLNMVKLQRRRITICYSKENTQLLSFKKGKQKTFRIFAIMRQEKKYWKNSLYKSKLDHHRDNVLVHYEGLSWRQHFKFNYRVAGLEDSVSESSIVWASIFQHDQFINRECLCLQNLTSICLLLQVFNFFRISADVWPYFVY